MSRKPIHIELAGGKSPRQRIWEAIRATSGKPFTQPEVSYGGMEKTVVRDYLAGLTNAGYLSAERPGKAKATATIYTQVRDAGAEAPRVRRNGEEVTQGRGNEAIWGAMQALGTFSYALLAEMSGATIQTVKSYCLALSKAGYLTVESEGKKSVCGSTRAKFRLLKSKISGPRPPMITRLKAIYDPNIHEIVWQQTADDAAEEMDK